jgi:hypothetical protein
MQIIVDLSRHKSPTRWTLTLARGWFGPQIAAAYRMTLLTPAF